MINHFLLIELLLQFTRMSRRFMMMMTMLNKVMPNKVEVIILREVLKAQITQKVQDQNQLSSRKSYSQRIMHFLNLGFMMVIKDKRNDCICDDSIM
jgi:predicted lipid carrier protein YhbT